MLKVRVDELRSLYIFYCRHIADPRLSELDSTELNSEIDKIEFEHVSFDPTNIADEN